MMFGYGHHYGHRGWGAGRVVLMALGGVVLAGVLGLVLGVLVQWLWNALLVKLLALPAITYWQAVGLFILAKLLFGGIGHAGPRHGFHRPWHRNWGWHGGGREEWGCGGGGELFERFWEDEGRKAFDAYVAKMRTEGQERRE